MTFNLFYLFIVLSLYTNPNFEVKMTYQIVSGERLDMDRLQNTFEQLKARFENSQYQDAQLILNKEKREIDLKLIAKEFNDEDLARLKLFFTSNSFQMENLFNTKDDEVIQFVSSLPEINGFLAYPSLPKHRYQAEVIGTCADGSELEGMKQKLSSYLPNKHGMQLYWSSSNIDQTNNGIEAFQLFLVQDRRPKSPQLSESNVKNASVQINYSTGQPDVLLQLDKEGSELWRKVTTQLAEEHKSVAIILNGRVYSTPKLMSPITNGMCIITGNFTFFEAEELALRANFGPLPYSLRLISEEVLEVKR